MAQSIGERIAEIDAEIIMVAGEAAEVLRSSPTLAALDSRVAFLRTLFRRRDCMLSQYAQQGGDVKSLYTFDAVVNR